MTDKPDPPLDKLLELAKRAPELSPDEPLQAPPGLVTSVAARWSSQSTKPSMLDLLERMGIWSLGGAVATCIALAFFMEPQEDLSANNGAFESILFGPETDDDVFGLF